MFEDLAQLDKLTAGTTSLAYRGIHGEYVLSNQKEVDRYRVCSGDNSTEFGTFDKPGVPYEPWHGFIAVSKDVDYTPTINCTMFVFS
jgi:hypothetical protein